MLEVICASSLFLSTNAELNLKSIDLAFIDTAKSTLIQPNILLDEMYLADNESDYNRTLKKLRDRFKIIIPDPETDRDRDANERRREIEDGQYDSGNEQESDYRRQADEARDQNNHNVPDSDSDNQDGNRDADQRRQELEVEYQENESYPGEYSDNEQRSDYRRQADEARDGTKIYVPDSNSNNSDDEDNSDRDADQRRRELE